MADDTKQDIDRISKPGGKPTDSKPVDYAFWEVADSPFKVIYSLSLFHEIDFVVNEGYRKIPHGGIEEGGLLFGSIEDECVRIEAYRSIECEHASGPSFVLSERDMTNLEAQLMASSSDPDLEHLQPLGWFLTHTRSPLTLTDLEVAQFDKLFPQVSRLTVLIKPERFQPTRFGFLVRDANRNIARDATASAIILPLPGRSSKQGNNLIPSIPAPAPSLNAKRLAEAAENGDDQELPPPPPRRRLPSERNENRPAAEPLLQSIWKVPPEPEDEAAEPVAAPRGTALPPPNEDPRFMVQPPTPDALEDGRSDSQRAARKQLARDRARVIEESLEIPDRPLKAQPPAPSIATARPMPERTVSQEVYQQIAEFKTRSSEPIFNSRSLSILAIAALLGCIVGYVGYLQLPAPVIALEIQAHAQAVTVSWPAEETKNSTSASVRVNNSEPVPLSTEEKTAGKLELSAPGDVKVEVIARNWMRDSRGVVHYLRSENRNASVLPSDSH